MQLKLSCCLLVSACATAQPRSLELPALSPQLMAEPPEGWPDEPAVILQREEQFSFGYASGTWLYRHDVLKVLNEGGLGFAQMQIAHSESGMLSGIAGRVVSPDGRETVFDPSLLIRDQTDVSPDQRAKVFIVVFPGVEVGSVLQLHYVIRERGLPTWYERPLSEPIPIRFYRATIVHDSSFTVKARLYNADGAFSRLDEHTLALELAGIPKQCDDPLISGPALIEPYWIYVLRYASSMGPVHAEWTDAVDDETRLLYAGRRSFAKGWKKPELPGCSGRLCVEAAVAELRRLRFSGFGSWPGRDAAEIALGDQASGFEKARLLFEMLAGVAGVEVSFALTSRRFATRVDETFPRPASFDHLIVRAKVGPTQWWIDPSCDYCELGQLPPWLEGARALVLGLVPRRMRSDVITAEWSDVRGEIAGTDLARTHFELRVSENGDATGRADLELAGVASLFRRLSTAEWSDELWRASVHEALTARISTARLQTSERMSFDSKRGIGGYTFQVPGYATPDEGHLLVPLTVLRGGFVDMLGTQKRRAAVTFPTAAHDVETIALILPDGFEVERLPEPFVIDHPYFRVAFEAVQEGAKVVVRREIAAHVGQHRLDHLDEARTVLERYDGLRQAAVVLRKR